jgi:hypothetical protein
MIVKRFLFKLFPLVVLSLCSATFSYADEVPIVAEIIPIAEEKRISEVEAARIAEEKRISEVEAARIAEEKRIAEEEAARIAEEKRIAEEEAARIAEEKKIAEVSNFGAIEVLLILLGVIAISLIGILSFFKIVKKGSFFTLIRRMPLNNTNPKTASKPLSNQKDPEVKIPVPTPKEPEIKIPSSDIEGHISSQTETIRGLRGDISTLLKNISDMNQTFMTLKTNLDQKDKEISRYKNGYDATIFKNFLLRFTRVDKVIKEYISENNIDLNGLEDIQIQMDDALAECDVETFSPKIGADFKTTIGVADNPEIRKTSDKSKDSTIAEILKIGYRRRLSDNADDDYQIIIESKVAIYVHKVT